MCSSQAQSSIQRPSNRINFVPEIDSRDFETRSGELDLAWRGRKGVLGAFVNCRPSNPDGVLRAMTCEMLGVEFSQCVGSDLS
jgi:hypothetical protein